jgi:hypothetical protein
MQQEIGAANPHIHVQILGVNRIGQEAANGTITANRTLPWLQETEAEPCWTSWQATWRDVDILDPQNRRMAIYNLTEHDLSVPSNYDTLKAMILAEANR